MRQSPANPMQAAAYLRHIAAPAAPGANAQVSISFGESVSTEFLRHAWQVVVQRHPILRSAFTKSPDGVMVREADKAEPQWVSLDWQSIPPADIPGKWADLLASDARCEFEPIAIPLVRFHELRLPGGAGHHLLTVPRFLLDDFSIARVLLDLLLTMGQSPLAPAIPVDPPAPASGWEEFLADATAPMHLDPRIGDGRFVRASLLLSREKTTLFNKLCHDRDWEPSLVVRCLWSLLLRRFGAAGDVMLCHFDARGDSREAGFRQNWLPIPHFWAGPVAEWLDESQTLTDRIAENVWINPDQALHDAGLTFSHAEIPVSFAWRGPSVNDIIHTALPRWINFDAQIQPMAAGEGLALEARPGARLELVLSGPLGGEAFAKDVLARLAMLLEDLDNSLLKPVEKLPVLLPDEIRSVRDWSHGAVLHDPPANLVEGFRRSARAHPRETAVRCAGSETTYEDIDTLSDRLAARLEQAGFSGGWHAALFLTPSAWTAVAMLGVWKSGNSCLALDTSAPREWVEKTLLTHDVALVLCDSASATLLDSNGRTLLVVDEAGDSADLLPPERPLCAFDAPAASIAGHADAPPPPLKALTHGMLASAVAGAAKLTGFRSGDVFLVRAMPGGGAFFDEWLIPLLHGGVALVASDDSLDAISSEATHLRLTANEWANQAMEWMRGGTPASPSLRSVAVECGAPLGTAARVWKSQSGGGIRQTFFHSPAGLLGLGIAGDFSSGGGRLPVGLPAPECEVLLLDEDNLELPPGFCGTIHLRFPGGKALDSTGGRFGMPLAVRGWRDGEGRLHLESEHTSRLGVPTRAQITATAPLVEKVLDLHFCDTAFALAAEEIPGIPSVREWLLNRAGWVDESALPKTSGPGREKGPTEAQPTTPRRRVPSEWEPVTVLQEGTVRTCPLVLVHPANGKLDDYHGLVSALGGFRRVLGIAARGAFEPEASQASIESAAATHLAALFEEEPGGRFQLAGFGFGALIVLEMGHQLHSAGRDVPPLALIGAQPPVSDRPTGWLAAFKKALGKSPSPPRLEPFDCEEGIAAAHESAWQAYRFRKSKFPATVILPIDLASEHRSGWQEILPECEIEITKSAWGDLLALPGVKRVASILNKAAPAADGLL
jgi:hypothetical protein